MNAGAVNQLGFNAAELLGMSPLDIKPAFTPEGFRRLVQPLLAGVQPSMLFQTVHRHKNGHEIPVEVFLQFVNQAGLDADFVAIVRDITERKRGEEALAESEARTRRLLKAARIGLWDWDLRDTWNTATVPFNPRFGRPAHPSWVGARAWPRSLHPSIDRLHPRRSIYSQARSGRYRSHGQTSGYDCASISARPMRLARIIHEAPPIRSE